MLTLALKIIFLFQILAKRNGLKWQKLQKLGDLQQEMNLDLPSMAQMVKDNFHSTCYTKEEICKELETLPGELDEVSLTPNTKHIQEFKLYQRALHVFQGKIIYLVGLIKVTHQLCLNKKNVFYQI